MRGLGLGLGIGLGAGTSAGAQMPAGLVLDLNANVPASITLTSGKLTAIADQSGTGHNYTSFSTGVTWNATDTDFGGRASFGGTGNVDSLVGPSMSTMLGAATGAEIFWAIKMVASATAALGGGTWGSGSGDFFVFNGDGNVYDDFASTTRQNFLPSSIASALTYNAHSTNGNWTANVNGVQAFTTAVNTFTKVSASGTSILASGYTGKVRRVLMFSRVLTSQERTTVLGLI